MEAQDKLTSLNRGYIFKDGACLSPPPADIIPPDCGADGFVSLLKGIDGMFSLAARRGDYILAAVDRVRSHPLFYAVRDGQLLLDSDAFALRARLANPGLDHKALREFLITGYCTFGDTLVEGLRQLEAGKCLIWHQPAQSLEIREYFRYTRVYAEADLSLQALDRMHERVFGRLIDSLGGRPVLIPLSGGYDSRLVAVMLKRLGYSNVTCFSYRGKHRGECETSRKVARFLNYPWHLVEQTRGMWHQAFNSRQMREFFRFSTHLSSAPYIQDWLAVRALKERGLVPDDAVFVPGHSGDFPEGGYLPQIFEDKVEFSRDNLLRALFDARFKLWKCPDELRLRFFGPRIAEQLRIPEQMSAETAASFFDEWCWAHHQSNFIVNSVRVYEFFGHSWRLPHWDLEFMEFWRRVPLPLRLHRYLYKKYVRAFQPLGFGVYKDVSLERRVRNAWLRNQYGEVMDPRYGRFLDYRDRYAYLNTRVESLLEPNICYPDFVNGQLPLLRVDLNALQALAVIREFFGRTAGGNEP